jgi:hypothetical protein
MPSGLPSPGAWSARWEEGFFIVSQTDEEITMSRFLRSTRNWIACGIAVAILFGLSPAFAVAGGSVHGHGEVFYQEGVSPGQISIDAWLDETGVAHGMIEWEGGVLLHNGFRGGPADPWHIDVLAISFDGNTAHVKLRSRVADQIHRDLLAQLMPLTYLLLS